MSESFLSIINMSLIASYVVLAVLIIRLLIYKAPKIFSYILWGVVFFRLICPISFESSFSMIPAKTEVTSKGIFYSQNDSKTTNTGIVQEVLPQEDDYFINSVLPSKNAATENIIIEIVAFIWVLGIFVILSCVFISYFRLRSRLDTATIVRSNVFETDQIKTPFVLGLIKPKIYIPIGISESEMDYVIKHEQTHIRRCDYIIKPLAFLVLTLHWFNPLAWLSYFLMTKDMEMSCDESVMKRSSSDIRASYSRSLLSMSVKQSGLLSPLAFGESNTKSRIKNVLNYKRPAFIVIIVTLLIVMTLMIGLATNPVGNTSYENEKYGFSIVLSKNFANKVEIKEQGNIIYFMSKDIKSKFTDGIMGAVGRIEIYSKKETTKDNLKELEDAYNLRNLGENDNYYFGWAQATDVQVPHDASEKIKEEYRTLEKEFTDLIKSFKFDNGFEQEIVGEVEGSGSKLQIDDDYSIIVGKQSISLKSQNVEDIYKVLGKPIAESVEVLGSGSDTYAGSRIKTLKYEDAQIKLFSPKDKEDGFWVMSMDIIGSSIRTLKGISIGSTLEELKKAYNNIEIVPEGRKDKTTYTYRCSNQAEYKYMEFIVKDKIVTNIRLYVELP